MRVTSEPPEPVEAKWTMAEDKGQTFWGPPFKHLVSMESFPKTLCDRYRVEPGVGVYSNAIECKLCTSKRDSHLPEFEWMISEALAMPDVPIWPVTIAPTERDEALNELYYQGLICVFMQHPGWMDVVKALLVANGHNTLEQIQEANKHPKED